MKMEYEKIELQIIAFDTEDVITISDPENGGPEEDTGV